ncbi:MAG: nickel-dependent lactate racemase [Oscillospiraceae bacterium]|nr:nickel-dependent lactate racemase [Oscillospiraceae bacterium]
MYKLETKDGRAVFTDTGLELSFSVPEADCMGMRQTRQLPGITDPQLLKNAFLDPVSGKRLRDIARERDSRTACILISDATRGVPTAPLAKLAVEELLEGGMELEGISFFVAIGVHREATEEELKRFLGELYGRVSAENHTPFDADNLLYLGKTTGGTPVTVNKRAYECDLHIQIGKVEPHEFAGFSGGRKSVLPGVCSEETIRINHRPEMILDPRSAIGELESNPVNRDMTEAAELFRIDFGVNCILNNSMELAAVFTGGLTECHAAAVSYVRDCLSVELEKPDIIVTTAGEPLDIDFYQSVKALIALTEILDDSVVTLMYCGCPEGVNSPDMLRAFGSSDNLEEVVSFTTENYEIQMDHVLLLSKIFRKGAKIVLCCPNVSDGEARTMFMEPCRDAGEAMELCRRLTGKENPKVLFYPRPQTGLPVMI